MEYELDAPTIIQWGSESESFLRYRYKAIRRQIGLVPDEVDRPKNDAILAAAVCAAKLSRKKLRPDGHPISSLHAENTDPPSSALGSTRGNAKPPTVPVSAQKGREYSRFPGSYFDDILRYFNLFEQRSAQKPPETQDDWISLFSSVTKKIDANDPCVTSVDLSRYKVRQILERNSSAEVQEQRNSLLPAERKEVDPDNPDTAILGSLVDMKIANKPHVIDEQYAEELLAKILALPAPPPGKKGDEHWIHCSEVAKILDIIP